MNEKEKKIEENAEPEKEAEVNGEVLEEENEEEVVTDLNEPSPEEEIERLNKEIERLKNNMLRPTLTRKTCNEGSKASTSST